MTSVGMVLALVAALAVFLTAGCAAQPAAQQPQAQQSQAQAQPAAKPAAPAQAAPQKPASAPADKPAASAPAPAAAEAQRRMFLGGAPSTSTYYAYHVAEARYLNKAVPKVSLTVVETSGGTDNITRLSKGEISLGVTGGDLAYQAYHGLGSYKGKQQAGLRYLWMYAVGSRVAFVREEADVQKLTDLTGKDFNAGPKGTGSEAAFKAHANLLGIQPKYYQAGGADAFQAIKDRRIIGMMNPQPSLSADALTLDLMTSTKVRPIGYSDDEIKKLQDARPWDQFLTLEKDEWARGAPGFKTLASVVGSTTTKDNLSPELVYDMTKAMLEPKAAQEIAEGVTFLKGWDFRKRTLEFASIPLHAGVVKYLREIGGTVPASLLPPEAQ